MIGDDIVNDVGGAQNSGLFGVQVRTGKFRYLKSYLLIMFLFMVKWVPFSVTLS